MMLVCIGALIGPAVAPARGPTTGGLCCRVAQMTAVYERITAAGELRVVDTEIGHTHAARTVKCPCFADTHLKVLYEYLT